MWLKKMKKKKFQCFLIGVLLFLSSLIFASSLCMVTSIKDYVNKFYSNDKFYELILFNANEGVKNDILEWCKSNSEIDDVQAFEAFTSGNDLYNKGENLKISMYDVVPIEDTNKLPFGLDKVISLSDENYPKEGEVWVPQIVADNFNITLGDELTFKTNSKDVTLKVTSLINDSNQPSTTSSQIILYTNKNSIKEFSSDKKAPLIFIDVKNDVDVSCVEKDLASAIKVGGFTIDKDLLIQTSIMTSSMVGGICTLASLLIFIVSVMLIRFIVWNNILKEYKSIGIYKSLGFSEKEILKFYIIGYLLTGLIGSVLGALCSIPVLNYTASKILKYIGKFNGININFTVIFATIFLFSFVVITNLYFVIRRTNKISPVEALRTGVTSSKRKLTKSLIKNNVSPIVLAINDIFKYKKVSVLITLTLTLALTLVLLFGNMNGAISQMKQNTNIWFGIPKSNVTISAPLNINSSANTSIHDLKNVLSEVESDDRIKNYVYGSMFYSGVELDIKKYNIKSTLYGVSVMNSFNKELGFTIIDGHNPEKFNEVSLSLNILKESGLSIGDYIELSINNKKNSYLITGSFNSLSSNGHSIRMLNSAVQKEFPEFIGSEVFVNLKDKTEIDDFTKDINNKFALLDAGEIHPLLRYSVDSIPGTLLPMTYLLMVVFIAFSAVTILNIIIMNVRDNRRNFGIMKALGFSFKEIRRRYLYRILILSLFSIIIAVIINLTVAKPIIAVSISNLDVLTIYPRTMIALLSIMMLLMLFVIFISCRTIKNTKPTELMEE